MTNEMVDTYTDYPSREEMAQYLTDINLGYKPEKDKYFDWFKLIERKKNDLEKYWLACKLTHNLGDITKIEDLPYADFCTVSFPCQSISVAGKMKGLKPDSGTRSSLLWDNIRLLSKAKENNKLPQYIMFENVKNLVSKKFIADFNDLLDVLDELGFNSYWSVINGKDCGIPQSRERVFVISIRKDIDKGKYEFPVPFDTGIRLKDVLENQVDEKYYLPDEKVQEFLKTIDLSQFRKEDNKLHQLGYINDYNGDANRIYSDNVARTLKSEAGGGAKTGWYATKNEILKVGKISSSQDGIVASPEGVSKTHTAGHNNMPKIICGIDKSINDPQILESANCITSREDRGVSNRKAEGTAILEYNTNKILAIGQVSNEGSQAGKVYSMEGVSQTICACTHGYAIGNIFDYTRIRKLTPRECYRLMGLTFEDCDKATELGVVDTHLYKQAGNGIITNSCALLAEHLYKAQYDDTYICTDERLQGNFTKPQAE
ncbi:DNA (cytosine-5-)-methyltransferase [bacterium 1xD42-87]|nr:DNA (cytosine-5-)-methyltransferase [bacterium 1xD42-87]